MLSRLVRPLRAMFMSPTLRHYAAATTGGKPLTTKDTPADPMPQMDAEEPLTSETAGNDRAACQAPPDSEEPDLGPAGRSTMPTTPGDDEFDESDEVERSKKVTLTLQIETTTVVKE